ncbi:helix-turn-helix domain-containing protein [Nonomuraea sp. NPDC048881]|uniref:helix-turn-helix domain-containing protein n=1 Tax=Nonomuraea sp. NPDC048881 TaxID=3155030 RepID=UPI0033D30950
MPGSNATPWTASYTRQVAENIRHHRRRQGLSVQNVADRCAAQGYPLQRNHLTKLESGHRASLTVAELLVLAHALTVPPVLLLAPLGRSTDTVEILPGVDADPGEAVFWLDGTAPLPDTPPDDGAGARAELQTLRAHRTLVGEWSARARAAAAARGRAGDENEPYRDAWRTAAHDHAEQADHAAERISHLRDNMRLRGLPLPDLPPGLIHLDLRPE